ncbi:MAG: hypothetical protein AAF633_03430 [Chloroflexota bacterium]
MFKYFYNFTLNSKNCGYSYLQFDQTSLLSNTRFLKEDGEIYANTFLLKLDGQRVLACKHGSNPWISMSNYPPNHFPSCAYPLLLPRVSSNPYSYVQLSEDDGSVISETILLMTGDDIVESQNGIETRRFTMRDKVPIKIDWGSAISYLCETADEAIADSGIEFIG